MQAATIISPGATGSHGEPWGAMGSHGEFGQDFSLSGYLVYLVYLVYLAYNATRARIERCTGPERGTSSRCRVCGWQQVATQSPRARLALPEAPWSFQGHRDVVGSVNRHPLTFGHTIDLPAQVT